MSLFDRSSLDHVPAIQHGKKHECDAIDAYKATKAASGQPVCVRSCGIALDTRQRYIGASPDGMVFDRSSRPVFGLLEVKCPFTPFTKSLSVSQAAEQDTNFCLVNTDGQLQLKRQHPYYYQVQGQLAVCNMQWCDFFV